jgi:SNF2-related domain
MATITKIPSAGQIARVRQRLYLVESTVAPPRPGDSTLVSLSCVEDDAQGQRIDVLWDREIDPEIITGEEWDLIARRGFDPSKLFAAYLNTLKWNCVTSTDPRLFQSPFRAGIKLDAYQLEPLRKALRLPRVNLFIADDVGLGKTIEAGLITRELLLRKKTREVVVCCPPSMLFQWKDELEVRFGLTFEILDKEYMKRVHRERGFGINPWSTHSRFLVSHRLLIDESYAAPLRDWLGDFRTGTLFILDEAHHAAPASGQRYAIDSQITRAVRDLAHRFEHRLFLSATPHNGHSNSFSALLEILDPQRFCRGVPVTKKALDDVMVRRIKEDIREIQGGFPKLTSSSSTLTDFQRMLPSCDFRPSWTSTGACANSGSAAKPNAIRRLRGYSLRASNNVYCLRSKHSPEPCECIAKQCSATGNWRKASHPSRRPAFRPVSTCLRKPSAAMTTGPHYPKTTCSPKRKSRSPR